MFKFKRNLIPQIVFCSLLATTAFAGEETPAATDATTAMPEEMQLQMAKMKEAGSPGIEHTVLNSLEGKWNVSSKFWMKPDAPEETSTATAEISWVLGGRFLKQDYKGSWSGQAFDGMGFLGYDKIKKAYVSIWMDNMMTGISQSTGQYDAASKTIKAEGSMSCPMTGETDRWFRDELAIINEDKFTYSMFAKDETGKEFKGMELTYERVSTK